MRSFAIAAFALACAPSAAEAPARAPMLAAAPTPVRGHFADAAQLTDLVVAGELDGLREAADAFVERHASRDFPRNWHTRLVRLMAWADVAGSANDLDAAALAVARLQASCGACHREQGISPGFVAPAPPLATATMPSYGFAVDRLAEGLVGPSPAQWQLGSEVYNGAATCDPPRGAEARCNAVHALAGATRAASTDVARTHVFADVIGSCASCHAER